MAAAAAAGVVGRHFGPILLSKNSGTPLTEKNHTLICAAKLAPIDEHMKTQVEAIKELKESINRLIELRS